jgi:serine/threonine-protein kinase
MIRLQLLGSLDLRDENGRELGAVLAQPKRLAILAYLAAAFPAGPHRRDILLGLFWPELDQDHARNALNQAVRFLRRCLGDAAVVARSVEEVALGPVVGSDVRAFDAALEQGRLADALELYRGEFLPAFFLSGVPAFEAWLERERTRLRTRAAAAARLLAERHEEARQLTLAVACARRAVELSDGDERPLRRLIELLDRAGDRAGAVRAYEAFARRLAAELEVEPAPETVALIRRIRASPAPRTETSQAPLSRLTTALADRYKVERRLGAGAMAIVALAHDLRHHRRVAIKVLRPELACLMGPERFLREIDISASLVHPHILPLHDSGEADGLLYYVMPYVDGESLRGRLEREGRLPIDDALRIAREVADALTYAHQHGFVHRDIKPENILLGGGHALVADFGIARAIGAGRERMTARALGTGTPAYMSPEQALGEGPVDARTDIYALGCVLYEMLTGEPPFSGTTTEATIERRLVEPAPRAGAVRKEVDQAVDAALARALARSPAGRFSTVSEFAAALVPGGSSPPGSGKDLRAVSAMGAEPPALDRDPVWGPRGAKRVPRASAQPGGRRILRWGVWIGAAAAGLLLAARVRGFMAASPVKATSSVAVLPFANRTGLEEDVHFTEGVRDEVLRHLYKVAGLRVKGPATMEQYRGSSSHATEIGRALAATHVLSGGVLRAGPRVRISVQLTETGSGDQVWAESYDRELSVGNLLDVQSDIAARVATQLIGTLSAAERASLRPEPSPNLQAYENYLRGRHALDHWGRSEDIENALVHFARALRQDSGFAPAWAGVSHALREYARAHERPSRIAWLETRSVPSLVSPLEDASVAPLESLRREVKRLMVLAAERAVGLDSTLAYGFTALAGIRFEFLFDNKGAEEAFRRAIALQPNDPRAHDQYGAFLTTIGRHREAYRHARRAIADEPFSVNTRALIAHVRFNLGDRAGGLREYAQLVRDYPSRTTPLWHMALRQGTAGRYDDAILTLRRVLALMGDNVADETALMGYLHGRARRHDSARAALRRLDELEARGVYVSPVIRSWPYIGLGERDSAYWWLERAVQEQEPWLVYESVLPAFDPLREDRRYAEVLRLLRSKPVARPGATARLR